MTNIINTISWLIFDSGLSGYEISQRTGMTPTTIYRLKNNKQSIGGVSTSNALKLYELAVAEQEKQA